MTPKGQITLSFCHFLFHSDLPLYCSISFSLAQTFSLEHASFPILIKLCSCLEASWPILCSRQKRTRNHFQKESSAPQILGKYLPSSGRGKGRARWAYWLFYLSYLGGGNWEISSGAGNCFVSFPACVVRGERVSSVYLPAIGILDAHLKFYFPLLFSPYVVTHCRYKTRKTVKKLIINTAEEQNIQVPWVQPRVLFAFWTPCFYVPWYSAHFFPLFGGEGESIGNFVACLSSHLPPVHSFWAQSHLCFSLRCPFLPQGCHLVSYDWLPYCLVTWLAAQFELSMFNLPRLTFDDLMVAGKSHPCRLNLNLWF